LKPKICTPASLQNPQWPEQTFSTPCFFTSGHSAKNPDHGQK
jgi:hypothetical protein